MRKIVPIFFACDESFVKFTAVSLKSMMENSAKDYLYKVYILHTDIKEGTKKKISDMAEENYEIHFEDVSKYLESISDRLPLRHYYSKTTYFRMFIAEMFSEYDKAVYIDSDTIVKGDISELFNTDIGENLIGACTEQVMVQEDMYGTYAEKVVGVDRNKFFNAGVLLINCKLFREEKILDKFIDLLYVYNFIVTQDEDYLNVLCKDRVYFLEQIWNTEVFGKIPYSDDEIKIIHYIMVSKPWHYKDCRYSKEFFDYAKKTVYYDEILQILENYSEDEKRRDEESAENLYQMAKSEIEREDGYYNMVSGTKKKSPDRIKVLNKIAKFEREGRFFEDVEEDPPTKELKPEDIDYLREKMSSKIKARLAFRIARLFVNKLEKEGKFILKEIKGIEHFKNLETGAIVTCNHFNALDSFAIHFTYEAAKKKKRKFFRVIREGNYTNFPGFYGILMRNCNTFPLSSNKKTMEKFMKSMDKVLKDGHYMLVYPEQSMWWNYKKPKPLKNGAFNFAVRSNVPVLPCFITMEDSKILDDDGFFVQEYTVHVSKPIYPRENLTKAENIEYMKQENFEKWKEIYEETYKEELVYNI